MNNKKELNNEKPLLQPKIDIVFQSLFNKDNILITKSFAEALLEEKISSIIINEDKELIRNRPDDKLGILDLELDINNKEKVDVEIQLVKRPNFIKRLIWYYSRKYSKQLKRGDDYEKLKRVVLVAIIDFDLEQTKDIKEMETIWRMTEAKNNGRILTDEIELRIIELRKAKYTYKHNKNNEKVQWMMFLNNPNSKEVKEIMEENEEIKDAVIKVKEMTADEKMERLAFLREKAIMDEKAIRRGGYEDGKAAGETKGKEEIIKEMLLHKIDDKTIKEIAKIDDKELERIKKLIYIKS